MCTYVGMSECMDMSAYVSLYVYVCLKHKLEPLVFLMNNERRANFSILITLLTKELSLMASSSGCQFFLGGG